VGAVDAGTEGIDVKGEGLESLVVGAGTETLGENEEAVDAVAVGEFPLPGMMDPT